MYFSSLGEGQEGIFAFFLRFFPVYFLGWEVEGGMGGGGGGWNGGGGGVGEKIWNFLVPMNIVPLATDHVTRRNAFCNGMALPSLR